MFLSMTFQEPRMLFLKNLTAFILAILALQTVKTHFIYKLKTKSAFLSS